MPLVSFLDGTQLRVSKMPANEDRVTFLQSLIDDPQAKFFVGTEELNSETIVDDDTVISAVKYIVTPDQREAWRARAGLPYSMQLSLDRVLEMKGDEETWVYLMDMGFNVDSLAWAHPVLLRRKSFIKRILQCDGADVDKALKYADRAIKDDDEMAAWILCNFPYALRRMSARILNNKELILEFVSEDGEWLSMLPKRFRNDRKVVRTAIATSEKSLRFASKRLRLDPFVVLEARLHAAKRARLSDDDEL